MARRSPFDAPHDFYGNHHAARQRGGLLNNRIRPDLWLAAVFVLRPLGDVSQTADANTVAGFSPKELRRWLISIVAIGGRGERENLRCDHGI